MTVIARAHLARALRDKLSAELTALRGGSAGLSEALSPEAPWSEAPWPDDLPIGDAGLGVDSLDLMGLASSVNSMFHLHETGIEDYLLARRTFGAWVDLILEAQSHGARHISFQSSGSSGPAKTVTHRLDHLWAEARDHAERWPANRILSAVPAHHIYGFIWTVLLPTCLNVDCIDIRGRLTAGKDLKRGDLIVSFPDHWAQLARLPSGLAPACGVSSTAPMPPALSDQLRQQGLAALIEIYGASETAGIGWRDDPQAAYQLFERWPDIDQVPFPDHVRCLDARHFLVAGRRDGAVQIGGINIYPEAVERRLAAHPDVAAAKVRAAALAGGIRLKAALVPVDPDIEEAAFRDRIQRWARANLSAPERPRSITVLAALPKNDLGKDRDWEAA